MTGPDNPQRIDPAPFVSGRERALQRLAALILLIAPALFAWASFTIPYQSTHFRNFGVPILAAELGLIVLFALSGLDRLRPLRSPALWAQIAAFGIVTVATYTVAFVAVDRALAQAHLVVTLIHLIFAATLWAKLSDGWRDARRMLLTALAAGLAGMALVTYGLAWAVRGVDGVDWLRFGAGISHVRHVGYAGCALTGLAAGLLATATTARDRAGNFILLVIGFFWTDMGGGRASFIAALGAAGLVWLLAARERRARLAAGFASAFAIAAPLSLIYLPGPQWGLPVIFSKLFATAGVDDYTSRRGEVWAATARQIMDAPLLGHGEGQFRLLVAAARGVFNHPHNAILQVLFQWGAVGMLCVAVLIVPAILRAPRAAREEPVIALPAIGGAAALLALALLDGPLFYALPVLATIICLVMIQTTRAKVR